MEKRLVVGLERLGAERLERFAQPASASLIGLQPLGMDGAISFELGLETGLRGTRGQPADHDANDETDAADDQT